MKHLIYTLLIIGLTSSLTQAQDYTFNEDIAPILFNNCTTCHRSGEIGPFPLTTYAEAKPWANMIDYVTSIKYMPPWSPDPAYTKFQGERALTDEELLAIKIWVNDGAPEGPGIAPELPEFPTGSQIGTPDLVLNFEESFEHRGNNQDDYRVFVLPTNLTEDKVVKAIEVRPGNTKIVHHALITYDDQGIGRNLDNQTSEYGYQSFGGFGDGLIQAFTQQFPGYVPGQKPAVAPIGIGQILPADSDILIQMHYAPVATDQKDSSKVNIFFAQENEEIERIAQNLFITPFNTTGDPGRQSLIIEPNEVTTYHYRVDIPVKMSIFAITPHMHLLGKDWLVYAIGPQGDTTKLISIPEWDFNWQGSFNFNRFKIIEPGSTIHAYASYDNTADNPSNPNNPPRRVTWGDFTTDEMFFLPISFVLYNEGDEDLLLNEVITSNNNFPIVNKDNYLSPIIPNPVVDQMTVKWRMKKDQIVRLQILSLDGKVITNCFERPYNASDEHQYIHNTQSLKNGSYILRISGEHFDESQLFQKF